MCAHSAGVRAHTNTTRTLAHARTHNMHARTHTDAFLYAQAPQPPLPPADGETAVTSDMDAALDAALRFLQGDPWPGVPPPSPQLGSALFAKQTHTNHAWWVGWESQARDPHGSQEVGILRRTGRQSSRKLCFPVQLC